VDGMATNLVQLRSMDVSEIERVEILDHPSAKFGAESNFAMINIITKRLPEAFYKGRIGLSKELLMGGTGADPSFSFKKGKWLIKTSAFYSKYKQKTNTDVVRNSQGTSYLRSDYRETDITQMDRNSDAYAIDHNGLSANTVRSALSDVFVEASYTHDPKWFASTEHDFGAKYVDRSFLLTRGERFKQRNIGLYSDWSIRLNEKINVSPALYLDVSNNDVNGRMTRYTSFLPSASLSVKSGRTGRVSASYRRRINRPNPVDLNGEIVVLDPTTFQRGNPEPETVRFKPLPVVVCKPLPGKFPLGKPFLLIHR